jgi:hypothetical protein
MPMTRFAVRAVAVLPAGGQQGDADEQVHDVVQVVDLEAEQGGVVGLGEGVADQEAGQPDEREHHPEAHGDDRVERAGAGCASGDDELLRRDGTGRDWDGTGRDGTDAEVPAAPPVTRRRTTSR